MNTQTCAFKDCKHCFLHTLLNGFHQGSLQRYLLSVLPLMLHNDQITISVYKSFEGCGVSVSVYDVDVDSGLDWGVFLILFLSSCSSSSFYFSKSLSQSLISSSLFCPAMSFPSSKSDQSDLSGMGYLVGHNFPVGMPISKYLGDL